MWLSITSGTHKDERLWEQSIFFHKVFKNVLSSI